MRAVLTRGAHLSTIGLDLELPKRALVETLEGSLRIVSYLNVLA